jgi:hypothetical protein
MQVFYRKLEDPQKKNCYEFEFLFEHGDGDSDNSYSVVFNNMNEDQLIAYVQKSNEISEMIEDSRSNGTELPSNFEIHAMSGNFYIPVERDNYAKMHVSNYYAASGINNIYYYDEHGIKFEVTVK